MKKRSGPSPFEMVIQKYPERAALIRRQLVAKSDFRNLCEDYVLLREKIAELEAASPGQDPSGPQSVRTEYDRLREELEHEIGRALASVSGPSPA